MAVEEHPPPEENLWFGRPPGALDWEERRPATDAWRPPPTPAAAPYAPPRHPLGPARPPKPRERLRAVPDQEDHQLWGRAIAVHLLPLVAPAVGVGVWGFFGLLASGLGLLVSLSLLIAWQGRDPWLRRHLVEAVLVQLSIAFTHVLAVAVFLGLLLSIVGWLVILPWAVLGTLLAVPWFAAQVWAAVRAGQGRPARVPLVLRLARGGWD